MAFSFSHQYDPQTEQSLRNFYRSLSEKDRRRFAAIEANKLGHGGVQYIASVLGCSRPTIQQGKTDLESLPNEVEPQRIRRNGGGRKKRTEETPELTKNFF